MIEYSIAIQSAKGDEKQVPGDDLDCGTQLAHFQGKGVVLWGDPLTQCCSLFYYVAWGYSLVTQFRSTQKHVVESKL